MNTRQLVREELEIQRRQDAFWRNLYRRFPLAQGHQELARSLLQKNMAKMADMSEEQGLEFLGDTLTKEIGRRQRRDAASAEARIMSGSGMEHGHSTDGANTFDADDSRFDVDPRENSLGARIRARRADRLAAQRSFRRDDNHDSA